MGCCISKCTPSKHSIQEFHHVQDKLVISQAPKIPKTPIPLSSNKISPCPPSPTPSSTSSVSSLTCTNSNTTTVSSCSSMSTGSSNSFLNSKDRSFSNDFLLSCLKENPHISRISSIKECSQFLVPPNARARKLDSPAKQVEVQPKQMTLQRVNGFTPQKRVRSHSPTAITRQKSFRRDAEKLNPSCSLSSRTLRSPSPSRRFNGESNRGILTITAKEISSKRVVGPKINASNFLSSSVGRENLRPLASPFVNSCLRNRETCIHRISSKIDEVAVQEALAHNDNDSVPMEEDIDNPLISLDCFIFL